MKKYIIYICIGLSLYACNKGETFENNPPETQIFVESINLSGDNRLNSVVSLFWSGEDIDGYIKGFELSINSGDWVFVTAEDSTFKFDIPEGSDTVDVSFEVRAIDNLDLPDPTPASLIVPIKNTPPTAKFDSIRLIPDTVFSVFSAAWQAIDIDGQETLSEVSIKINEGDWYTLDPNTAFITLVPSNPTQTGSQNAQVYIGSDANLSTEALNDLRVGDFNEMYIKAQDISGAESPIDTSNVFYIEPQGSDLLVIDAHTLPPAPDALYNSTILNVYGAYDYLDLTTNFPTYWDPTFGLYLQLYDKIFWYSNGFEYEEFGERMLLEVAALSLNDFVQEGGKLFVTAKFPSTFNSSDKNGISSVFSLLPMDSLATTSTAPRIRRDSLATPSDNFSSYPTLKASAFITGADPFYASNQSNIMYSAELFAPNGDPWLEPTTICARKVGANGRTNQVFVSVELHLLQGDLPALQTFIDKVLNEEFNW